MDLVHAGRMAMPGFTDLPFESDEHLSGVAQREVVRRRCGAALEAFGVEILEHAGW
jgi:hypothetical protein